jgi:MOSC domain-containing protein YiiM
MRGTVRALFVTPEKKGKPVELEEVQAGRGGFDGDFHARVANRRQILMLSHDVLAEFRLTPGALRENMVVEGIDVMMLAAEQKLRVGGAVLEVTGPCDPCIQMDRLRDGLRSALEGKRGMFLRVHTPGTIRVGDAVEMQ